MEQRLQQLEESDPTTPILNPFAPQQNLTGEVMESVEGSSIVVAPVENIQAVLSQEVQNFRRRLWRSVVGFALFYLITVRILTKYAHTFLASPVFVLDFVCVSSLLVLLSLSSDRRRRQRHRHLTVNVVKQHEVRSIGPLIDALKLDDIKAREIAQDALTSLLPRLRASDTSLLNAAQRANLCQLLSLPVENPLFKDVRDLFRPAKNREIDIRVAILQAFEQVGDSKALSVVERLAKRDVKTVGEKRIQEAAKQCLPALQLRAEEQRSSQTLLRAADVSSRATDTLLRAATGMQEAQSEQLLRPSS